MQGDYNKRLVNEAPKLGTVHFVDGWYYKNYFFLFELLHCGNLFSTVFYFIFLKLSYVIYFCVLNNCSIVEPKYKKTLLAIVRTFWDIDTVDSTGKTRDIFLARCAEELRVLKYS